jgi:dTDP-4-amino-4,6-dideoxygalactose transaminase
MIYRPGRIFLSVPHMGGHERNYVLKAIEDNWVTTIGPNIVGFEHDICQHTNARYAVALNSGTAAIHLALRLLKVNTGDEVLCSTFTSIASANPILYQGASPVFIDCEADTWNMCPQTLRTAIESRISSGKKPSAILLVHLYGMPASMNKILAIAEEFNIPIIEDAAEALGSRYSGHQVGTFGQIGIFSFNGNKIITTSGGGAIITGEEELAEKARFLSDMAKEPTPYCQHSQMGYNYRLSNISAGIGRGQIGVLESRVKQRREVFNYYRNHLDHIEGLQFLTEPKKCFSNRWLTTILLPDSHTPESIRLKLEEVNIETIRLWKPLHLQPIFANNLYFGDNLSIELFERGLCLPSSSNLSEEELEKVVKNLKKHLEEV